MADALRAIDERGHTRPAGHGAELGGGVHEAERVRGVREREELRSGCQQAAGGHQIERGAIFQNGNIFDFRPGLAGEVEPWKQVAVVLHLCEEDRVARADVFAPPRVGHEVDRLGRAASEDDLLRADRVHESGHIRARGLVGRARPLAQCMNAAVDVRVFALHENAHPPDDAGRLLRACRAVEIDQREPVHALVQKRELPPPNRHVIAGFNHECGGT